VATECQLLGDWPNENCRELSALQLRRGRSGATERSSVRPTRLLRCNAAAVKRGREMGADVGPDNECIGIVNFCTRRQCQSPSLSLALSLSFSLSLSLAVMPLDAHLTSGVSQQVGGRAVDCDRGCSSDVAVCLAFVSVEKGIPEAQTNQAERH